MIASHDTLTYLHPRWWILRLFKPLWKTQRLNIAEQMEVGVGYLDIRVRHTGKGWRFCHGWADLGKKCCPTVVELLDGVVPETLPFRLLLERGGEEDISLFETEWKKVLEVYPNLDAVVVKRIWKVLRPTKWSGDDSCIYMPWLSNNSLKENIKRFLSNISTPYRWAKKHNSKVTEGMRQDPNSIYWLDFVELR